jgi:hypothetical protein
VIGQHVRMLVAPYATGTVKSARFHEGKVRFLFQHDHRFATRLPDVWLLDSELEECVRPADEEVTRINKLAQSK